MVKPERRENEERSIGAGPMPEGFAHDEERDEDSASRDQLPLFPRGSRSAGTLDLAAANDEPTQLIRYLIIAARENLTESEHVDEWQALLGCFERADKEIARMQDPSHKRVNDDASKERRL